MKTKAQLTISTIFVIFVLCLSLVNANTALADDAPPTEPPTATEEATEPPTEEGTLIPELITQTPTPPESALPGDVPVIDEEASLEELLSGIPDNTDVVILDENGTLIPLVTQAAADIIQEEDPLWCPVGAPLNSPLCRNFTGGSAISNMLADMRNNTNTYDENGVIYFTSTAGGSLALTNAGGSLSTDFALLRNFNLTLVGGWNGNTSSPVFSGQTSFGSNSLTIGTSGNPWVGNITLSNFVFNGVSSSNAVTIYTTNGDITLNNVDVAQQSGGNNTALLNSNTGDITVQNGSSFDGNNSGNNQNKGFSADTNTGSITITGTSGSSITFTDARGCGAFFGFCIIHSLVNYNGATLSASTVTLNYVTANNNDLNGIQISNANLVTLNNVVATNNGTDFALLPDLLDAGSGILVNGTGSTVVSVTGGSFSNNERYGLEVLNGSIVFLTNPTCTGNDLGCVIDNTPPILSLPASILMEATGPSGTVVTYSASANDNVDGAVAVNCSPASGSTFAITTTTVNCSASDSRGNTSNGCFAVTIQDTTAPVIAPHADITEEATSSAGNVVTYTNPSTSDAVDGAGTASCLPASGSTFGLGDTTVTCNAADAHGNAATPITFVVHIVDTTAPIIASHADITEEATSSAGNIVTYTNPSTSDAVDGAGTASCLPASGSTFGLGNTTVTCTAADAHGNAATPITFVVHIGDTTPPTISPHANIIVDTTDNFGALVSYFAPGTFDTVDGSGVATCTPPSGNKFPIGETVVICTAMDAHGNLASPVKFSIFVEKRIVSATTTSGFFIPLTGGSSIKLNCVAPNSFKVNWQERALSSTTYAAMKHLLMAYSNSSCLESCLVGLSLLMDTRSILAKTAIWLIPCQRTQALPLNLISPAITRTPILECFIGMAPSGQKSPANR